MRAVAILLLCLFVSACATGTREHHHHAEHECGYERWAVKTLTDADTLFSFAARDATIGELGRPHKVHVGLLAPRMTFERDVVRVHCRIIGMKREADGDIHLVIDDRGNSMVAEIPNPDRCPDAARSGHADEYRAAIDWCRDNLGEPKTSMHEFNARAIVTGVVFQDSCHGQAGMSRNCREIHPVLKLETPARNLTADE